MAMAAIAYVNKADSASLTASSQLTLAPVTLVQNPHVGRKWRSTSNTANFVADMGNSLIDTVSLEGLTATTARVRWSSVDATGVAGDIYDSGVQSVDQNYLRFVSVMPAGVATTTGRYLRVDLTNPSLSYVEQGRLFAGLRTAFDAGVAFGWQRRWIDRSIKTRMRSGGTQVFAEVPYAQIEATFEFVTDAERRSVVDLIDIVNGEHRDVLFLLDPASANLACDSVWGLITQLEPVQHRAFDVYQRQYTIEQRQ